MAAPALVSAAQPNPLLALSLAAPAPSAGAASGPAAADELRSGPSAEASARSEAAVSERQLWLRRMFDGSGLKSVSSPAVDLVLGARLETWQVQLQPRAAKPELAAPGEPAISVEASKKAQRQVLVGTGIFKFGMEALGISVPLIALTYFGSAVWMATMAVGWGACMTVASMFSGGLIDRKPVQKVLAGAMALQAGAVAGMIGLLLLGVTNPWAILPLYSLAGASMGVVVTARNTLPARLLGRDHAALSKFNSIAHIVYEVSGTVAPLLVGLLISRFGLIPALILHPPMYLLSAWAFSRLKFEAAPSEAPVPARFWDMLKRVASEVRAGARVMLGQREFRWIWFMLLGPAIIHRVVEQMLVPVFAKNILAAPEKAAWLVSSSNFGELLGALVLLKVASAAGAGLLQKSNPSYRWIRPMAVGALAVWSMFSGVSLFLVLPVFALMSLAWVANEISLTSELQSRLPESSAGKAIGFLMASELGAIMGISYLVGMLFDILPVGVGFAAVNVAISLLAGVLFLGYSWMRKKA
jgi:hypothetical protein